MSNVSVTLLSGMKWLPCRVKVPPWTTVVPPLRIMLGATIISPTPIKLSRIRIGIMIAAIIKARLHPCGFGEGVGGLLG